MEVLSLAFGYISPSHRGKLEFGDEKSANQVCRLGTDATLGEIGDQDAAVVHHEAGIDLRPDLADDVSDGGGHQQSPDLVLDRGDRFGHEAFVPSSEFLGPELSY